MENEYKLRVTGATIMKNMMIALLIRNTIGKFKKEGKLFTETEFVDEAEKLFEQMNQTILASLQVATGQKPNRISPDDALNRELIEMVERPGFMLVEAFKRTIQEEVTKEDIVGFYDHMIFFHKAEIRKEMFEALQPKHAE